jgi:hypothetical protein
MDFDPLAYLKERKAQAATPSGEFDPAAYMASRRTEALKAKHAKNVEEIAALKENPETGFGAYVKAGAGAVADKAKAIGRGVATLANDPVETVTNDAKRREMLRGIDDTLTFGYGQKLAAHIDEALPARLRLDLSPEEREAGGWDTSGRQSGLTANAQTDAQAAPDFRTGGAVLGAFTPGGAANTLGKGVGTAVRNARLGGFGGGVASHMLVAPVAAGLHADAAAPDATWGQSIRQRLQAAAEATADPASILLAGTMGAAGSAIKNRVGKTRGAQARQTIEQEGQGAKVGLTTPGSGGVFDQELKGIPANDKGVGVAAKKGATGVLKALKEERRVETSEPYKALKAQIDASPAANQSRDVTPIVDNMRNAAWDLDTDAGVRAQLEQELTLLERYRAPDGGPVLVDERQLNGLRRSLGRMAKLGRSDVSGEKEAPLRQAFFTAKTMVDQGPYAALNEAFEKGASKATAQRRQLGLPPRTPSNSAVDERKLKLSLLREDQNTVTAGGDSDIAGFRAANPQLAPPLSLAKLAKARADLSFHMAPTHGPLSERIAATALGPAAAIGAATAGHGAAGLAGAAGIMALQNATPIAGRVLYPATKGLDMPRLRLLEAQQLEESRRRQMAAFLANGGRP